MAKQVLTRTPTSSGNRRRWTWAGWIKRNHIYNSVNDSSRPDNGYYSGIFAVGEVDGSEDTIMFSNDKLRYRCEVGTDIETTERFSDPGAWMHVCISVNTEIGTNSTNDFDRITFYVNGVKRNHSGVPSITDLRINLTQKHYIGEFPRINAHLDGEMSDVFFVDGAALMPEVFGYHKDDTGYMSSGVRYQSDIKKGQWVPRLPKTIINEINEGGGFGTNGFYLPMNDASNIGADFHCTPNSIVKLKGEDLPQPRNGAPENYTEHFRDDPYKDYLSLAVPCISTKPNLIKNGSFNTNTENWTAYNSVISLDDGRLVVNDSANAGGWSAAVQEVTTIPGQRYCLIFDYTPVSDVANVGYYHGAYPGAGTAPSVYEMLSSNQTKYQIYFQAQNTTTSIIFNVNNVGTSYFDNISLREVETIQDFSATIKGTGINKILTENNSVGIVSSIPSYYGSALAFKGGGASTADKYTVTSTDFAFGDGDWTAEAWIYPTKLYNYQTIFTTRPNNGGFADAWHMWINGSGATGVYSNSFLTTSHNGLILANQWTHIVAERHGSKLTTYVNGVAAAVNYNYNQTTTRNVLGIGQFSGANSEQFTGFMTDLRIYKGVAKYKKGFDVSKPYTPENFGSDRESSDNFKNNFCTLNSIYQFGSDVVRYNCGNLIASDSENGGGRTIGTMAVKSGKWYYECQVAQFDSIHSILLGWAQWPSYAPKGYFQQSILVRTSGVKFSPSTNQVGNALPTMSQGDIVMIAFDADTGKMWAGLNGSWYSNSTTTYQEPLVNGSGWLVELTRKPDEYMVPYFTFDNVTSTKKVVINFGQNSSFSGQYPQGTYRDTSGKGLFRYEPPKGFLSLCNDNLPKPKVKDPGEHFKPVIYEGAGSRGNIVHKVGFRPDLVWIKERDSTSSHELYDTIRGPYNKWNTDTTNNFSDNTNGVRDFNEKGFTVNGGGAVGEDQRQYVAYCWKGGDKVVTNTEGSITAEVSANKEAGFSVIKWTGNNTNGTVGHGLGTTPKIWIAKRGEVNSNIFYFTFWDGSLDYMYTNLTNNKGDSSLSLSNLTDKKIPVGANTLAWSAYAWAEVEGYSKFGTYYGNNSQNGPYVYCGFKPAFLMVKSVNNGVGNWLIVDSARSPNNPVDLDLYANLTNTEVVYTRFDFLSNGFKVRNTSGEMNGNNVAYIFMAFAESPFQTTNAK